MTINKNQGQTLTSVGVYLHRPVFTHDQLYVVVSRVTSTVSRATSKNCLKILIEDENGNCTNEAKNVVYREVFSQLPVPDDD
jgi:ATP-dependent DNA helicase PIF1